MKVCALRSTGVLSVLADATDSCLFFLFCFVFFLCGYFVTLGARGSIFLLRGAGGYNGEVKNKPLVTAVTNLTSMQVRNKISCQTGFLSVCLFL